MTDLTPAQSCQTFPVAETKHVCGSDPAQCAVTLTPAVLPFPLPPSLAPGPARPADLCSLRQGPFLLTEYSCAPRPWPTHPPPWWFPCSYKKSALPTDRPLRTTAASRRSLLSHPGLPRMPSAPAEPRAAHSTLPACCIPLPVRSLQLQEGHPQEKILRPRGQHILPG